MGSRGAPSRPQFLELENTKYVNTQSTQGFQDLFTWLPASRYAGTFTFNGTAACAWTFAVSKPLKVSILASAADGTPLYLEQNTAVPQGAYRAQLFIVSFATGVIPGAWDGFDPDAFRQYLVRWTDSVSQAHEPVVSSRLKDAHAICVAFRSLP